MHLDLFIPKFRDNRRVNFDAEISQNLSVLLARVSCQVGAGELLRQRDIAAISYDGPVGLRHDTCLVRRL